jgi:hypothetical protein
MPIAGRVIVRALMGLLAICAAVLAYAAMASGQPVGGVCSWTPFQASATTPVTGSQFPGRTTATRVRLGVTTGSNPSQIQFFSLSYDGGDSTFAIINTATITTTLSGRSVTHGIEISSTDRASARNDVDISRVYPFYADPSSSVRFDVELFFATGVTAGGDVTITVVGQTTEPGCGFGG